jgi:hypothetical protein
MHATPQIVTSAMQLYFTVESLRNVKRFFDLQGGENEPCSCLQMDKEIR